jgi:hypothetical protein
MIGREEVIVKLAWCCDAAADMKMNLSGKLRVTILMAPPAIRPAYRA